MHHVPDHSRRTEPVSLPEFRIDMGTFPLIPPILIRHYPHHSTRRTDDLRNPRNLEPNQMPWGNSSLSDSSDPIFSMYVKISEEEDNKKAGRWKADADGILIFVSASIIFP
jgi:hypothetical protein